MNIKEIKSIHGEDFVIIKGYIEPESSHLMCILWLVSTQLRDLKTVQNAGGLSNAVCEIERNLDSNNTPIKSGLYWTNSWIWKSFVIRDKSNNFVQYYRQEYFHFPFDPIIDTYAVPPIPKHLFDLYKIENPKVI